MAEPATAVEDDFELNVVDDLDGDDDEPPPLPSPVPLSDGGEDWDADPSAADDGDSAPPPAPALQSSFLDSDAFKDAVLPAAAERSDGDEPGADAVLPAAAERSDDDGPEPGTGGGDKAAGATHDWCLVFDRSGAKASAGEDAGRRPDLQADWQAEVVEKLREAGLEIELKMNAAQDRAYVTIPAAAVSSSSNPCCSPCSYIIRYVLVGADDELLKQAATTQGFPRDLLLVDGVAAFDVAKEELFQAKTVFCGVEQPRYFSSSERQRLILKVMNKALPLTIAQMTDVGQDVNTGPADLDVVQSSRDFGRTTTDVSASERSYSLLDAVALHDPAELALLCKNWANFGILLRPWKWYVRIPALHILSYPCC